MHPDFRGARAIRPGPAALVRASSFGAGVLVVTSLLASCGTVPGAHSSGPGTGEGSLSRDGQTSASSGTGTAGTSADAPSTLYPALVADARWVTREGERALVVTPTTYLREHGSVEVAEEAWRRVSVAVPDADTPGMQDQFICHAQYASTKTGWYLEPARPAVGYPRTVLTGCNPGTQSDVG